MARWSWRGALIVAILLLASRPAFAAVDDPHTSPDPLLWGSVFAWLVPIGLGLIACGAVSAGRVAAVIRVGWLAMSIGGVVYWLCGFAFQFGGLGLAADQPGLAGLVRMWNWAPLDSTWGNEWGVLGLTGYMLRGPAATPEVLALFFSQLPWITTAVAVPLWSLQGRAKPFALFLSGLLFCFVYVLIGNWVWGGGWLGNLGLNLGLGHGFVDWAGASAVHLAGAAGALAGMLAFGTRAFARSESEQLTLPSLESAVSDRTHPPITRLAADGETYVPMPPLHLPLLATLGAWLAVVGWMGWVLSTPASLVAGLEMAWVELLVGLMLATGGGALLALAFSWLTTGEANALMTARGVLGATVAVSAGLPFLPFWACLATGAGAGLLVPLVQYAIEHLLRLDDPTSAIATHGVPALWGLLAVGLFADGHAGQGWNRVGAEAYLNVPGQGITGYLAASGNGSDWPGQFQAQATGAIAVLLVAFFLSWLLFAAIQGLTRAWQGEYTIRLPRRQRVKRVRLRPLRWPRVRVIRAAPQEAAEHAGSAPSPVSSRHRWTISLKARWQRLLEQVRTLSTTARRIVARRSAVQRGSPPGVEIESTTAQGGALAGEEAEGATLGEVHAQEAPSAQAGDIAPDDVEA